MELTDSFEIPRINLDFNRNNFVTAKIVHDLSLVKEIFITLLDLIAIISK